MLAGIELLRARAEEKGRKCFLYAVGIEQSGFCERIEGDNPVMSAPSRDAGTGSIAVYIVGHGSDGMLFHDTGRAAVDPKRLAGIVDGIGTALGGEVHYVNFVACSLIPAKNTQGPGSFIGPFMRALKSRPSVAAYNVAVFLRPEDEGKKSIQKGTFSALAGDKMARNYKRVFRADGTDLLIRNHINKARRGDGGDEGQFNRFKNALTHEGDDPLN